MIIIIIDGMNRLVFLSIAMRYQLHGNSEMDYHLEPAKEEGFPKGSREPRSIKVCKQQGLQRGDLNITSFRK